MKAYLVVFFMLWSLMSFGQNNEPIYELPLSSKGFFEFTNYNQMLEFFPKKLMRQHGIKSIQIYKEENDIPSIRVDKPFVYKIEFHRDGSIVKSEEQTTIFLYEDSKVVFEYDFGNDHHGGSGNIFYYYQNNHIKITDEIQNSKAVKLQKKFLRLYDDNFSNSLYAEEVAEEAEEEVIEEPFEEPNLTIEKEESEESFDEDYGNQRNIVDEYAVNYLGKFSRLERNEELTFYSDNTIDTLANIIHFNDELYFAEIERGKEGNKVDTIFFDKQWRPIQQKQYWRVSPVLNLSITYDDNRITRYYKEQFNPYYENRPKEKGVIETHRIDFQGESITYTSWKIFNDITFYYNDNGLIEKIIQTTNEGTCEYQVYYYTE